ncbi:MAG: phosphoribosylanthranilate isomerase [Candidatus Puniceispirillaceae bacterium]
MTATSTSVKICGISTFDIYRHCAEVGVDWIGMVFYARSPRHLEIEQAAALAAQADRDIAPAMRPGRIALVVDADDASLNAIIEHARPDMLQLHGHEPPARIAKIKQRFGLPVMPVITVSSKQDIQEARAVTELADWILFDAQPSADSDGLPGGTGSSFDWSYLANFKSSTPWMLAGGLNAGNVAQAIGITQAPCVDISSGVEKNRGEKSKTAISAFVHAAKLG